jgi:hypothetical protein
MSQRVATIMPGEPYRMVYAAPSLRLLFLRPSISRFWIGCFEKSASSLAVVKAARGGLEGGESQRLLWRTSGKPLGPCTALVLACASRYSEVDLKH